jgi:lipopolysaccharide export system permease protein
MAAVKGADLQSEARAMSRIIGVIAGRFKEMEGGARVFFAEGISDDGQRLRNVFVRVGDRTPPVVFSAAGGYQYENPETGDRFVVLVDGHRYEGEPGSADYTVTRFESHALRVLKAGQEQQRRRAEAVPTGDLFDSEDPRLTTELHWRFSTPASVLVLGFLAVPLARTTPRQGRFGKLTNAILIYFVYSNLLGVARELVQQEKLSPILGIWTLHATVGLGALALMSYQVAGGWRAMPVLRRFRRAS